MVGGGAARRNLFEKTDSRNYRKISKSKKKIEFDSRELTGVELPKEAQSRLNNGLIKKDMFEIQLV